MAPADSSPRRYGFALAHDRYCFAVRFDPNTGHRLDATLSAERPSGCGPTRPQGSVEVRSGIPSVTWRFSEHAESCEITIDQSYHRRLFCL